MFYFKQKKYKSKHFLLIFQKIDFILDCIGGKMKILRWNIDKNDSGYKINKAKSDKIIYKTLSGEIVQESARRIRKTPNFEVSFGRVVNKNCTSL